METLQLRIVCDFVEEQWPSMDLVAELLLASLRGRLSHEVAATPIRPAMVPRFSRLPLFRHNPIARNADRLTNRMWDYPRHLRRRHDRQGYFHICDHSYAHLVHTLPPERTGVYCHDLDCFRCLLEPEREPRPRWFRAMSRRILSGMQRAAVVFYSTKDLGRRIRELRLLDPSRLVHAPYGVAPEFTPDGTEKDLHTPPEPFLLHVGSTVSRKRIDVLLDVFAGVRARFRGLTLLQVGGEWTPDQRHQIGRLGIGDAVRQCRGMDRPALAALYRRARVVLQPSEAEGFGLPVVEALACGSLVVASDIPVLREVGGVAVTYAPVADILQWVNVINTMIAHPERAPDQATRLMQAKRYSLDQHAQSILRAYQSTLRDSA
jgi:glycosyltransferase involved in cell wall biosynthesis